MGQAWRFRQAAALGQARAPNTNSAIRRRSWEVAIRPCQEQTCEIGDIQKYYARRIACIIPVQFSPSPRAIRHQGTASDARHPGERNLSKYLSPLGQCEPPR